MTAPILNAQDLARWYGEVVGLNGVTFSAQSGITGLLGPNGSGKSTLLNLATGQLKPSRGSLQVLGEDPWSNRRLMARIGFLPETDTFWEWMTGLEFVTHLTRLHGHARGDAGRRAERALRETEVPEDAWTRPLSTYSRGMRQKTKLAQALAHEPDLLILDEPLNGADPISRRHINATIRRLAAGGTHVVVSSHVLHEVEALTRDIVVLSRGRLVARGQVEAIRRLIDEHPHPIRLGASDPRRLAGLLLEEKGVVSVRFEDDGVHLRVETRDPDRLLDRAVDLALSEGLRLRHVSEPDANLQAVFDYLFEGRREVEA